MNHEATPGAGPDTGAAAQSIHETLYDGADVPVTYKNGRTEMVKVRKVPRCDFGQYSLLVGSLNGDESAECAFYVAGSAPASGAESRASRDLAWAESLDDESYDRVLAEGQRLNFTRYANWFERQARKLKLVQGQNALVDQAVAIMEQSPTLKMLLASTNGSSARDTATPISGDTRPRN